MALNNLSGRIPRVTSAMSPRLIYIGVGLAVIGVCFVIYGFHYRIVRKERLKAQAVTQMAAADAATSNRIAVHGASVPPGTEAPQQSVQPPPGVVPAAPTAPNTGASSSGLPGALRAVAQPFGAPPPQPMPLPEINPAVRLKAEREERAYERRMAAVDAPTSPSQSTSLGLPAVPAPHAVDPLQSELAHIAANAGNAGGPPSQILASSRGGLGFPTVEDPNEQDAKRAFQKTAEGDYLKTTRIAPLSPWVVERGDVIPAGLPDQIVSDLPGDLVAEVKRDVYDSPQHKYVMIPAGSLLAGEYNSGVSYGQKRVQVVWTYLRFPDGSYVDLDKFIGHSADGATGLSDQVDNHLKRLVGGIALSSLFAAGVQISTGHTSGNLLQPSNTELAASAAGQQAAEVGQQLTNRNLNVQPTVKIRPGDVFEVRVMKSIVFPGPYKSMVLGARK